MIKFALRRNLIYPLQLIIWHLLRKFEMMLITYLFNFTNSLVYIQLMFVGEFFAGLIVHSYQNKFLKKEKEKKKANIFIPNELLYNEIILSLNDSKFKVLLLIFFISCFDWVQFIIWLVIFPKYQYISGSIVARFCGFFAIFSAYFYSFVVKIDNFKHQKCSLITIGICTFIIIVTEIIFQEFNIFLSYSDFTIVLLLAIFVQLMNVFIDLPEKYLFEYDNVSPFYCLMFEGLFGFLLTFIYFAIPDYLDDIKLVYNTYSAGYLVLFTFLLLLYIILCGGRNTFTVITTKIYSPTTRGLADYFINPIYLIFDFSL